MSNIEDVEKLPEGLESTPTKVIVDRPEFVQKCVHFLNRLGGEERGIERVLPEEKTNQKPFDNFSVWMSSNLTVITFSLGTLGPQIWSMGWWDSFLTIFFFNLIGIIPPAYMATFGPKTGLRTICFTRFTFGWYGTMFIACMNIVSYTGFSMVNSIVGGQIIHTASDGKCPLAVGIVLIAIVPLFVALLGYKFIHQYDRYCWIVTIIVFAIVAGLGAKSFVNIPMPSGKTEMSAVLNFGVAIFSFAVTWSSVMMDYNVNMKEEISAWSTFTWTYLGLFLALNFLECLGAAAMTAAIVDPQWAAAFDASNIGGLLAMCLQSSGGFGKVCLIILAFTIVTSIIPNNYSIGLSVQALGNWAIKIPRFLWTLAAVLVYVIAAVAGREHFATILDSFLNCLAYWSTPYALIIFQEHLIFKRGEYNLDSWNDKRGLPLGIAAFASWCGAIIVAVMSMSQNWYVGPIALAVGGAPHGADIGFELSAVACLLLYSPLRYLEKRYLEKNRPLVDVVAEK